MATAHFRPALFKFLGELAKNNRREWFAENKERYEQHVRHPALAFISDFGPRLEKISRHFNADPRPVGGSLFRIHRDTRFSKDKSPYKTAVGIQFRHKEAKDIHAPGFYLHLDPTGCFAGIGVYHPDGATLKRIRQAIIKDASAWKRASHAKSLRAHFEPGGDSLKRAPTGYDPDHPLIEDLRRKDFVAFAKLSRKEVTAAGFLAHYTRLCRTGSGYMRFLCRAVGVPF